MAPLMVSVVVGLGIAVAVGLKLPEVHHATWLAFGGWRIGVVMTPPLILLLMGVNYVVSHRAPAGAVTEDYARVPSTNAVRLTPPDQTTPAMAAWLVGNNGRVTPALLADLITRRFIGVAAPSDGVWVLRRLSGPNDDTLLAHEHQFLRALFPGPDASVTLTPEMASLKAAVGESQILDDLKARGLVGQSSPLEQGFLVTMMLGLLTPVLLLLIVLKPFVGIPGFAGVTVFCIAAFIGHFVPVASGRTAVTQSYEFGNYLYTAESNKLQWEVESGVVAGYLPWAIALGGVSGWAPWHREKDSLVPGDLGDLLLHAGLRNAAPVTANPWRMRFVAIVALFVIVAFETWFIQFQLTGR